MPRRPKVEPGADKGATDPAVEKTRHAIPAKLQPAWDALATEARRKRVRVEVRLAEGVTPAETADGDLRATFYALRTNRAGIPMPLLTVELLSTAIEKLSAFVEGQADVGANALRDELRAFGRRLSLLTPRELSQKRKGQDHRIYSDFRDRILPLAWDNLVDAIRIEAFEDFVRRVGLAQERVAKAETDIPVDQRSMNALAAVARQELAELAAEARGLVAPKEASDG